MAEGGRFVDPLQTAVLNLKCLGLQMVILILRFEEFSYVGHEGRIWLSIISQHMATILD